MRGMKRRGGRHGKEKKSDQRQIELNDFCKNKYSKENGIGCFVSSCGQFF